MAVKQISVFIENKAGSLAKLTEVLSANNINMRALSVAESEDFGIIRLIVDNVYDTVTVLKDEGYVSSVKDVLAVALSDEPGSLSKVLAVLGENNINIDYMYAFTANKPGTANMIVRVEDNKKAGDVLKANGISEIGEEDLSKM
ncbi:MAG: ACT domain-containing protein [Lachnospiraceae bacterium]